MSFKMGTIPTFQQHTSGHRTSNCKSPAPQVYFALTLSISFTLPTDLWSACVRTMHKTLISFFCTHLVGTCTEHLEWYMCRTFGMYFIKWIQLQIAKARKEVMVILILPGVVNLHYPAKKRRKFDVKLWSHLVDQKPPHNITS